MKWLQSFAMLLGRICLSAIFFMSAFGKLTGWEKTASYMASKEMTFIPLFLVGAVLFEVLGALSLFFGYKARFGALLLTIFLIPTTIIFHDFWAVSPAEAQMQMIMFLKNLAIFGGLLYVMAEGPGLFAIGGSRQRAKQFPEEKTESHE